ncbi:MAG: DEAD/DEAH box helicase [Acidimicrobiales bacterium]
MHRPSDDHQLGALRNVLRLLSSDDQLVDLRTLRGRPARLATLSAPLPPALDRLVPDGGLWSHQAAALDAARSGQSVAISTGTASGKSLCYQLPIAEAALDGGTALLVYPTKALAQDQLRAFGGLDVAEVVAVTYDGDSLPEQRAWARRHANVILTNPDMLHAGILPFHGRWADYLHNLRYVVLDELHTLRGVYGTHVAHLVRRLRRICAAYGADPVFVCCSATIGHPAELAESITGVAIEAVTDDGSPRGDRLFALWNPPLVDAGAGARASAHGETARILAGLVAGGHRSIAFTRSRRGAEMVATWARDRLPRELADAVRPYRGGYLAEERREIEKELWEGRLLGVAATNALELGVDIGGLDACILDGFPGTIASMWQQAGRAGRAQQASLAVLVAGEDALDQWLMTHPEEVFTRVPEPAVINPANPFVLEPHVACAAYERPLEESDRQLWGPELDEAVRALVVGDQLAIRGDRVAYCGPAFPASAIGLRSGSATEFRIVDPDGRLIGTVDESRAYDSVHPGAVYLHQGQHFLVTRLDLGDHAAWVEPADGAEWTQARTVTDLVIATEDDCVKIGRAQLSIGNVEVSQQVVGFQRKAVGSGEVLSREELDLPPTRLATRAFWYTIHDAILDDAGLAVRAVPGSLHAAEHAGIGMLPLFTICDRWDVGGVSTPFHAQTGTSTIFIYDGYIGGAGIAELGFASGRRHLLATRQAISACPCEAGCPSCVQSPKCGNWNEPLDKAGAVALLDAILADGA